MSTAPLRGPSQWLQELHDSDPDVRSEAKLAIGGLTPEDDISIEPFLSGLGSGDDDTVFWSLVGLSRIGTRSAPGTDTIAQLALTYNAFGIRQMAVSALSVVAAGSAKAKPTILRCLEDPSPFVRREALQSCIGLSSLTDRDIALISQLREDSDKTVARWAEVTLRNIDLHQTGKHAL